MSLMALKANSEANTAEQKRIAEKKRNMLVLIHHHLIENGYFQAAERLQHEAGSVFSKFEVADNVDFGLILGEYEAYYEMRFDKKPKLVRKLKDGEESSRPPLSRPPKQPESSSASRKSSSRDKSGSSADGKLPTVNGASTSTAPQEDNNPLGGLGVSGISVSTIESSNNKSKIDVERSAEKESFEARILKPPPQFVGDPEMRALAAVISREIYVESPDVSFNDIVRLDEAKRLLREAVQLPLQYPQLFTGILRPWKGILLHGPPGTGKTLLAKAVASECHTTFFNISASTLVSKWRGDSEKLVRALFEVARYHAPSTIFMDEMDSILTTRSEGGEHEASRRMKTELLIQMDGVRGGKPNEQVFVMAASNLPWDLDVAVLRRLEKRVLVPLPVAEAREQMLRKNLIGRASSDLNYEEVAVKTEGYSGADLHLVCREAAMMPVRRLMDRLHLLDPSPKLPDPAPRSTNSKQSSNRIEPPNNQNNQNSQLDVEFLLGNDPVSCQDLYTALDTTKPSSDGKMDKYQAWQNEFGSV
jgi:katanin p60 ATPase-containing subunit A1